MYLQGAAGILLPPLRMQGKGKYTTHREVKMAKETQLKKDIEEFTASRESKSEQPNLFGDQDFVYNTIETQLAIVREQIKALNKTIERNENQKELLEETESALSKAATIVRKHRDLFKEKKG